jgi:hypothetical protein
MNQISYIICVFFSWFGYGGIHRNCNLDQFGWDFMINHGISIGFWGTYFGKRPIEIPLPEDFLYHLHQRGPRRNGSDHRLPVVGCVVFDVGMGGISGELNQKSREIVRWWPAKPVFWCFLGTDEIDKNCDSRKRCILAAPLASFEDGQKHRIKRIRVGAHISNIIQSTLHKNSNI